MPTYGKIFDTAIPRYVKFLEKRCGLKKQRDFVIIKSPYPMLKYKPHIFKSEREIHFVSGSRPDTMVGVEVSDVWIDEPGRMSSQVFTEVMERLRCPVAKVLQVLMTGSPQGLNWWADEFDF
ncbi:MAG: hypothetical protein KC483_10175 [Nitrosarchaeum sp.]|nr:hypothetical protein [Nitrosarchaeum sp.]